MSCDCNRAKPLPCCITQLIIGEVADGSLNYFVYFKTPDGRIDRYDGVDVVYTDLVGVEGIEVRTGTLYEVWIAQQTAQNINGRIDFRVEGQVENVSCILIEFLPCYDGTDLEEFTSQSITLQ